MPGGRRCFQPSTIPKFSKSADEAISGQKVKNLHFLHFSGFLIKISGTRFCCLFSVIEYKLKFYNCSIRFEQNLTKFLTSQVARGVFSQARYQNSQTPQKGQFQAKKSRFCTFCIYQSFLFNFQALFFAVQFRLSSTNESFITA